MRRPRRRRSPSWQPRPCSSFSSRPRSRAWPRSRSGCAPRPGDLRGHGVDAQRLFARRGFGSLLLLPFRLLRLGSGTRETLMPYAPLLPLVSVTFLAATGLAALAGLGVLLLALFALGDLARELRRSAAHSTAASFASP